MNAGAFRAKSGKGGFWPLSAIGPFHTDVGCMATFQID